MRKILLKLFVIIIVVQAFIATKVFASDNFRIRFEEGLSVKCGETVEVPIIIDNINFDGIQKGVMAFGCKLDYDDTVFELVEFDNNELFKIDENLEMYVQYIFNAENNKLVVQFTNGYFQEYGGEYINNYLEIGKVKIKAKENILSGVYNVLITDVEGGNLEKSIKVNNYESEIYVDGIEIVEEDKNNSTDGSVVGETINVTADSKKTIVSITQNDEGTELYIQPDEENGIEIGKVVVDNEELVRKDGKYTTSVVPGRIYKIHLYNKDGGFIGTQIVKIAGEVQELINEGDTIVDDETTDNGEIDKEEDKDDKEENKDNVDKNEETQKDPSNDKVDETNKENDAGSAEGVQTGDIIIIPVCIVLTLIIVANLILYWKKLETV